MSDFATWDQPKHGDELLDAPSNGSVVEREPRACACGCGREFKPKATGWMAKYASWECMRRNNGLSTDRKRTPAELAVAKAREAPPPPRVATVTDRRIPDVAGFDVVDLAFLLMRSPTFRDLDPATAKAICREAAS